MSGFFAVSEVVARALAERRPVVALETTLVTHGLPPPEGVEVALELEREVATRGAVPATIGVLDGKIRVGLERAELERLAAGGGVAGSTGMPSGPKRAEGPPAARTAVVSEGRKSVATKLSLGNLAAVLAGHEPGSTTVAATLFAAARVGIQVFATGGIGGVHRGASETGDVSADLRALSRFPVAVVCAGAKAVLDLEKTVEMLETLGVPVFGLGTDEFPAFYRRSSGLPVDRRYDALRDLAAAVRTHFELGLGTGVVVGNPIPPEHEMPLELYERSLAAALADAGRLGVRGRAVTPYLLDRLRELTAEGSVFSNRALLVNNARAAAGLAIAMAEGAA
jgi:pseudouridine-5'-phosphate glycosidase